MSHKVDWPFSIFNFYTPIRSFFPYFFRVQFIPYEYAVRYLSSAALVLAAAAIVPSCLNFLTAEQHTEERIAESARARA